jgi:hypothetical protein
VGLERRLGNLEGIDRQSAAAEIRRAWDRLSDQEIALVLAPYHFEREPTLEEQAAEASFSATVLEALVARSIGYRDGLSDEEVSRRLREVTDPITKRRRARIMSYFQALEEGELS